jgi:hypothetical protein
LGRSNNGPSVDEDREGDSAKVAWDLGVSKDEREDEEEE